MDASRFDALAKALAGRLPRRRFLGRVGGGGVALLGAGAITSAAAAQQASPTAPANFPKVVFSCGACDCGSTSCCCLSGIVGGGVVQTPTGDDQVVLFASRTQADDAPAAAGFVRWIDQHAPGGPLTLESVGPFTYAEPTDVERQVSGMMKKNGAGLYPFVLKVTAAGPVAAGKNTASLAVGDKVVQGGTKSGYGYDAAGKVIGGGFQILDTGPGMPKS